MESAENPIHKTHPKAANHVGVGVSDIKEAVRWYQEILGFTLLKGPIEVRAEQGYRGDEVRDVLGPEFRSMLQAHMAAANGFGLELFQLLDPPHESREHALEYWKSGFSRFVSLTQTSRSWPVALHRPAAARDPRSGASISPLMTTDCAIAKIPLGTSSKSIRIVMKLCMAE